MTESTCDNNVFTGRFYRFVLGDFYCHVDVQPCQWVSALQQRPLLATHRTASLEGFGGWPEFVSSLEKLLVNSLCFHIRIQGVTPVTQSHWVCSAAACNWEPFTQRNPLKARTTKKSHFQRRDFTLPPKLTALNIYWSSYDYSPFSIHSALGRIKRPPQKDQFLWFYNF